MMVDSARLDGITAFFDAVATTFGAGDLQRLRALYALPCIFVSDAGNHPINTEVEFDAFFGSMRRRLAQDNFTHSVYANLSASHLSAVLAIASMHWTRYRGDGSVIELLGAIYTLHQRAGTWQIVSVIAHDAARTVRFT